MKTKLFILLNISYCCNQKSAMKTLKLFLFKFLLFTSLALPQAGSLDNTFGSNGIVTTAIGSFNDVARSIAIQGDGKIVAAGSSSNGNDYDFALIRYNSDGTPDN